MSGCVVWLTGLPSSGKSTLAARVATRLRAQDIPVSLLDGDEVRAALSPSPGYDDASRLHFYRTLAGLAALLAAQGQVVLVPATAHRRVYRDTARELAPRYLEVYVATPVEVCAERDAKGLYEASDDGDVAHLPGVGTRYDVPESPDVVAEMGADETAVDAILRAIPI